MEVADRIAVLNDGRIEQVGAPRELYEPPANAFVMGFLGPVAAAGRPPRAPARPRRQRRAARRARARRRSSASCTSASRSASSSCSTTARRPAAQLTRGEAEAARARRAATSSGCARGPPTGAAAASARRPRARQRVTQASGSSASRSTAAGRLAGGDVGQRDVLDDAAQARAHGDPDALQRLGGAGVGDVLRALAAHRGQRALDGADDVGDGDLRRRAGPASSRPRRRAGCARARRGAGRPRMFSRNSAGCPGPAAIASPFAGRSPAGGELDRGADRVVGLGGDAHAPLSRRPRPGCRSPARGRPPRATRSRARGRRPRARRAARPRGRRDRIWPPAPSRRALRGRLRVAGVGRVLAARVLGVVGLGAVTLVGHDVRVLHAGRPAPRPRRPRGRTAARARCRARGSRRRTPPATASTSQCARGAARRRRPRRSRRPAPAAPGRPRTGTAAGRRSHPHRRDHPQVVGQRDHRADRRSRSPSHV